jgi:hypothetical protein
MIIYRFVSFNNNVRYRKFITFGLLSFSLVPSCFIDSSSDDESVESSSDYEVSDDNTKKSKKQNVRKNLEFFIILQMKL